MHKHCITALLYYVATGNLFLHNTEKRLCNYEILPHLHMWLHRTKHNFLPFTVFGQNSGAMSFLFQKWDENANLMLIQPRRITCTGNFDSFI